MVVQSGRVFSSCSKFLIIQGTRIKHVIINLEVFIYNLIATPSATRKLTHMAEFFEIARL